MLEIKEISWQEAFDEVQEDILEDAFLLDALALYVINEGNFMREEQGRYFPKVFYRLCGYLSQHAQDLRNLQRRLERENRF